jgi:hypothetical protein
MKYQVRYRGGAAAVEAPSALEAVRKLGLSAAVVIRVELIGVEPRCQCGALLVSRGRLGGPARGEAMECPGCRRVYQWDGAGNDLCEVRSGYQIPVAVQVARGNRPQGLVRRVGRG